MLCKTCDERPAAKERTVCNTCRSRKWRKKNPIRDAWHNLKNSARKRNYQFDLPFEAFKAFAIEHKYDKLKGRGKDNLVIDRVHNNEGYTMDNIAVIKKSTNSKKYWDEINEQHFQERLAQVPF